MNDLNSVELHEMVSWVHAMVSWGPGNALLGSMVPSINQEADSKRKWARYAMEVRRETLRVT